MEKRRKNRSLLQLLMVGVLVSGSILSLKAQEPSYAYFDSLTYRLYDNQQWDELAEAGKRAIALGHEGYYLQIRTGIAFFKRGQYRRADKFLTRARELSPNEVSNEYAYLTKLWGGRALQANVVRAALPESVLQRLEIKDDPTIRSVGAAYTTLFPEKELTEAETSLPVEEAGSRLAAREFSHFAATLSHKIGPGVLTHEAGQLKKKNVLYIGPSELNDSLWMEDYQTNQFNYYLQWNMTTGRNWNLQLFGNGLWFDFPVFSLSDRSAGNNRWELDQGTGTGFDYVAGAGLTKSLDLVDLSLELAGASMADNRQLQTTASAIFYPFYNLRFYLGGRFMYNHSASDNQPLASGLLGGRVADFLWLEGSALLADEARWFHLGQGNLVFNGTEKVNRILGLHAIILPWKGFKGVVSWQQRQYVSYFISSGSGPSPMMPLNHNYQLISTSLLWTF